MLMPQLYFYTIYAVHIPQIIFEGMKIKLLQVMHFSADPFFFFLFSKLRNRDLTVYVGSRVRCYVNDLSPFLRCAMFRRQPRGTRLDNCSPSSPFDPFPQPSRDAAYFTYEPTWKLEADGRCNWSEEFVRRHGISSSDFTSIFVVVLLMIIIGSRGKICIYRSLCDNWKSGLCLY